MKFSLENKIIIGFGLALVILMGLGYYSYMNNKKLIHTSRLVSHTHEVLYHTEQILTLSLDIETGQRGYVLTGDERFLEPHHKAIISIDRHVEQLKNLTRDNSQQQRRVQLASYLIKKKVAFAKASVELRRKGGFEASQKNITSLEGQSLMNEIRTVIEQMQQAENILLTNRIQLSEREATKFYSTFSALIASIVFIIIAVTVLIINNLKSLKKASAEIHDLYNNAPCGYHSLDPNGVFVEINATELHWLGYKKADVVNKLKFSDVITAESRITLEKNFNEFKRNGSVKDLEFDMICKNGSILPIVVNSSALFDKGGFFLKSRSTVFDNTSHKTANAKINELNRELEKNISQLQKVNTELESFTYSVSHDLRAPLRSVAGFAQILKEDYEDKLDPSGKKTIHTIINNAKRMGQLIDDLLTFSRFGKTEMIRSEITMEKLIRAIAEEIQLEHTKPNVEVIIHPILPCKADINMIKQVWINLISNAFKYSKNQEEQVIEIGSFLNDNENIYYVKDNGVGFNMEYSHKLFGVFQRLHKMNEFEGTGVGLAIVKRIIDRHGGKVWADSKVNKGATFFFSLPQN